MRSALAAAAQRRAGRSRSTSLSTVPPQETSAEFLPELAAIAASILYRSPLPSREGRPVYILNAAAFPDAYEVDYDSLLSYVLARLPGEDELLSGTEYEVIFFAGGQPDGATTEKKQGPGMGWYLQAYHTLNRATRKRLQRLYIVHPRTWVRVLLGLFGAVVSPKFRRKIVHVNTLSQLAVQQPIYRLLIPPAVYLHDRKLSPEISVPYASGRRAFGAKHPFPKNLNSSTGATRLPRVLRETTQFIIQPANVGVEGLFRIPPHSTLAGILKEAYDRGQQFIIWKEKDATVVQPGLDPALVDEVRLEDAYGVHLAASLVKMWYRELRHPIFPEESYDQLRQRFSNPDVPVTPEDLVDIILPASTSSPLSATSREVLTRHLLPILSAIAEHEAQNKMGPENLAICFAMCLVRSSDQMADAKVSSIIRRVLEAAIEMWPQLREGLGLDVHALENDLLAPGDLREYEDPTGEDEIGSAETSAEEGDGVEEGHRIILSDADADEKNEEQETQRAPTLPPRPLPQSRAASAAKQLPGLDVTSPVKRKPISVNSSADTSPAGQQSQTTIEPPRYSKIFDSDGSSLPTDSPISYVSVDGIGRLGRKKSSNLTGYPDDKKTLPFPPTPEPTDIHPAARLVVPKRKALSSEQKPDPTPMVTTNANEATRSASDGAAMAKLAAQKAATALAARMGALSTGTSTNVTNDGHAVQASPASAVSEAGADAVFRKPSWPASATRQPPPPGKAVRQSQTVPIIPSTSDGLTAPTFPRRRTPSPGLLARMSGIEQTQSEPAGSTLGPQRLNLKKASVDDLRRLYEERVSTAESLRRAEAARRGSSSALSS